MKIKIIAIGKTHKSFLVDGENEYIKRIKKYVAIEKIEIQDIKNAKKLTQQQIKEQEGKLLLSKIEPHSLIVLLDEKGKEYTSMNFSNWLQQRQ
jgi:23S rRNA (pseudouridine1915-N3)-methyltransferase